MTKNSFLLKIRDELDKAITYQDSGLAMQVALKGLKEAKDADLESELEYFKGQIELIKENFALAIEHFNAAIKINPKDGGSYNDKALCLAELGLIDEAIKFFDKGIEVEPDYATIYHNKGWLLNNIGRHRESIEYFNKALSLEKDRAVTYDNLADALFNLGDYNNSLLAYRKVLDLLEVDCCLEIRDEITKKIKEIELRLMKE